MGKKRSIKQQTEYGSFYYYYYLFILNIYFLISIPPFNPNQKDFKFLSFVRQLVERIGKGKLQFVALEFNTMHHAQKGTLLRQALDPFKILSKSKKNAL